MEKGFITSDVIIVAHHQAAEVAQPSKGAFDLPSFAVAAQLSAIVEQGLAASLAVRSDQHHALLKQSPAQRVAVVASIGDNAQGPLARSPAFQRHANSRQSALGQSYFSRRGPDQLTSQRNTLAVEPPPCLWVAKTPSWRDWIQSSVLWMTICVTRSGEGPCQLEGSWATVDRILDTTGNQRTCFSRGPLERSISGSLANIVVMKTADQGQFYDVTLVGRFDGTRFRTILFERPVRAMLMIIGQLP